MHMIHTVTPNNYFCFKDILPDKNETKNLGTELKNSKAESKH